MRDDTTHPAIYVIATLTGIASAVWTTWCNVIAFTGGKLPLLPWTLEGSVTTGVLWAIFVWPFTVTVAYWASLLVASPLFAGLYLRRRTSRRIGTTEAPIAPSTEDADEDFSAFPQRHPKRARRRWVSIVAGALVVFLLGAAIMAVSVQRSTILDLRQTNARLGAQLEDVEDEYAAERDRREVAEGRGDALRSLVDRVRAIATDLDHCADGMRLVALQLAEFRPDVDLIDDVSSYCEDAQTKHQGLQALLDSS